MAAKENLSTQAREVEEYFNRKAKRQAPAWMPQPGDTFKGKVIKLHMFTDSEYGDAPVVTYEVLWSNVPDRLEVGATVAFYVFAQVSRERMKELGCDLDTVQWVSYDGKTPSRTRKDKDGNAVEYHVFDIENDGQESEVPAKEENFAF
jgi:hypothetical protein